MVRDHKLSFRLNDSNVHARCECDAFVLRVFFLSQSEFNSYLFYLFIFLNYYLFLLLYFCYSIIKKNLLLLVIMCVGVC